MAGREVADWFDKTVRLGTTRVRDMITVPIGPSKRMAVVAPPDCISAQPAPKPPQDLVANRRINQRTINSGDLYAWDFARRGWSLNVRVDGPLVFNTSPP